MLFCRVKTFGKFLQKYCKEILNLLYCKSILSENLFQELNLKNSKTKKKREK